MIEIKGARASSVVFATIQKRLEYQAE